MRSYLKCILVSTLLPSLLAAYKDAVVIKLSSPSLTSNNTCHKAATLPKNRIIGGVEADKHEFPWLIRLNIDFEDGNSTLCGGTLIASVNKYASKSREIDFSFKIGLYNYRTWF